MDPPLDDKALSLKAAFSIGFEQRGRCYGLEVTQVFARNGDVRPASTPAVVPHGERGYAACKRSDGLWRAAVAEVFLLLRPGKAPKCFAG